MRKYAFVTLGLSLSLGVGLICGVGPAPAGSALAQTYSQWNDPKASDTPADIESGKLDELLERLKTKIKSAEKARAADPRFLRDLRALVNEYETPWSRRLVFDDFSDGDFTRKPKWLVTQGRFWIERGQGLRMVADAPAEQSSDAQGESKKKLSREEKAALILGALLGGGSSQDDEPKSQPSEPEDAIIHTKRAITNAFALQVRLSSWAKSGTLEIGVFQENNKNAGYRIAYLPNNYIELLRVSRRGVSVIETSKKTITLENDQAHTLALQRYPNGRTVVSVDGKKVIDLIDKSFKDPFDGIIMVDRGGDYTVHQISADGTR